MTEEIRKLVEETIKTDLESINDLDIGTKERDCAIKDLDILMKMVVADDNVWIESEKIEVDRSKLDLEERKLESEEKISMNRIETDLKKLNLEKDIYELDAVRIDNDKESNKKRQACEIIKIAVDTTAKITLGILSLAGTIVVLKADQNGWFFSNKALSYNPKINIK